MAARDARGLAWSAVALVALVAAVAWLARERLPEPPLGTDAPPPAPAGAPAPPLHSPAASGIVADAHPGDAHPGERVAHDAEELARPASHGGVLVRVVRASDREPLPGAEVRVFDPATVDWLALEERVGRASLAHDLAAKHFSSTRTADELGIARIPHPSRDGYVSGTHGALWGRAPLTALSEEVVLALEPDLALDVLVTGVEGPVGGIEVLLWRNQYVADRERTGPDGRARFEHLARFRALAREHGLEASVTTDLLALDAPEARIDLEAWPREVALALPPTGALRFEVVEPDGRRSLAGGEVELAISGALRTRFGREPPIVEETVGLASGSALVAPIGIGLELPLVARIHGWGDLTAVAIGPKSAGEETLVVLRPEAPAPVVRGRLLRPDGAPLAHASLACELRGENEPQRRIERRRTDALGRFDGLGGAYMLDGGAWSLFLSIAGDPRRAAHVELRGPVEARVHELGDVVLDSPPLVASGRVVNGRGEPVRAARVEIEERIARAWLPRGPDWCELPRGIASTDADGRFELHSWPESEQVRLRVRRDGFVTSGPHEFRAPRAGWTIALDSGGSLVGRVLGAPGRAQALFLVDIERTDPGTRPDREPTWSAEGSFRFEGLEAGAYALDLRLSNRTPGSRRRDAVVQTGHTTELSPFRYDELVHELPFDVRDEIGARVPGATVAMIWDANGATIDLGVEPLTSGTLLLRTLEVPLPRLRFAARGHRAVTIDEVRTGLTVVLRRGPLVRLVLSDALVVGEAWSAWARPTLDGVDEPAVPFDAAGVATARVSGPGRYWVEIAFRRPDERGFATVDGLGFHVDVADSSAEQTFTAPPFAPAVLAGLERFAR